MQIWTPIDRYGLSKVEITRDFAVILRCALGWIDQVQPFGVALTILVSYCVWFFLDCAMDDACHIVCVNGGRGRLLYPTDARSQIAISFPQVNLKSPTMPAEPFGHFLTNSFLSGWKWPAGPELEDFEPGTSHLWSARSIFMNERAAIEARQPQSGCVRANDMANRLKLSLDIGGMCGTSVCGHNG
jgi:hypothetical protein